MKELLERWAELEPDRCRWVGGACYLYMFDDRSTYLSRADDYRVFPTKWENGTIQIYVQQAIEARGWDWQIKFEKPHMNKPGTHWATIMYFGGMDHLFSDDSPAHALLSAYIKALEATI